MFTSPDFAKPDKLFIVLCLRTDHGEVSVCEIPKDPNSSSI